MNEDPTTRELLDLADWRRRVADLYTEVRSLARTEPEAAHARWRAARETLYREHPQSPVAAEGRASFRALHFAYDPALRFEVTVAEHRQAPDGEARHEVFCALPTSTGSTLQFRRIGWVEVPFPAGTRWLGLYWMEGYAGGLFLPFGDATNGRETYGAGRYALDSAKSADLGGGAGRGTLILDFNFAYHPSCAFDPRWPCPLTPLENRLDVAVRAGERIA